MRVSVKEFFICSRLDFSGTNHTGKLGGSVLGDGLQCFRSQPDIHKPFQFRHPDAFALKVRYEPAVGPVVRMGYIIP